MQLKFGNYILINFTAFSSKLIFYLYYVQFFITQIFVKIEIFVLLYFKFKFSEIKKKFRYKF